MRYCLLILSALLVVSSCTKVEETKSKQEILRESKWMLDTGFVHAKWKADGTLPADVDKIDPYIIAFCADDDVLTFREGYDGAHIPGEKTCSINETSEIGFRWGITDNDTRMFIYDAKEFFKLDVNAELIEFYDNKFAIRYYEFKDKEVFIGNNPGYWVTDTTIYTMYFIKK